MLVRVLVVEGVRPRVLHGRRLAQSLRARDGTPLALVLRLNVLRQIHYAVRSLLPRSIPLPLPISLPLPLPLTFPVAPLHRCSQLHFEGLVLRQVSFSFSFSFPLPLSVPGRVLQALVG